MSKKIRNLDGNNVQDPSAIDALQYNNPAGSKKVSEVGRHLLPIPYNNAGTIAYTTDASTIRVLPKKGALLAVYNNAGAIGSVTLGESASQASLASGVTDASGHVGIPCPANSWTYIACGEQNFVIASAATLLVFLVDDDTSIKQSAVR